MQTHPSARGLRNRPFPHYDELAIVFGKDRATGGRAHAPTEASMAIRNFESFGGFGSSQDYYVPESLSKDSTSPMEETCFVDTLTSRPAATGETSSRRSKRKRDSHQSAMLEIVPATMDMQCAELERIASWPNAKMASKTAQPRRCHILSSSYQNLRLMKR